MAGEIVMAHAGQKNVRVLPVDSEHNAIFQCLDGRDSADVRRLILPRREARFGKHPPPNSRLSPLSRHSATPPGTWAGRSRSTPRRSSTKASR
jgi:1-deoxy-D-xylulose-5-phosphate reductoisomerase